MKAVVLGDDESILEEGSPSRRRMREYARRMDELHLVIAARRGHGGRDSRGLSTHVAGGRIALLRWMRLIRLGWILCRRVRPDLISAQTPDAFGLAGLILSRRYRLPLQIQVHTDILSPHYRTASWKERIRYLVARYTLRRASCIRVVSRRVAASLTRRLAIPESRIQILPIWTPSVDSPPPSEGRAGPSRVSGHGFRIVAAGRFIDREKNFSMLVEAVGDVALEMDRPLLVLAGDGPDRARYERLIRRRGFEAFVRLEPWRDDLASFLRDFDLFALPSNFEGWGRTCVEAAAVGVPVVMTDVGLAGELLVDGVSARIVPVGDRRALAAAMLELSRDPERRARLARGALKAVRSAQAGGMPEYYRSYLAVMNACIDPLPPVRDAKRSGV